jgi:hypothetical protein
MTAYDSHFPFPMFRQALKVSDTTWYDLEVGVSASLLYSGLYAAIHQSTQ